MRRLFVFLVMAVACAGAARADDRNDCSQQDDFDLVIRACSNIISAGWETPENVAAAYSNRGYAYNHKRDYDRAIADETKVIELDPKSAVAYDSRGISYNNKGDYDRAIVDESKAIELDPTDANFYDGRADAYKNKGEDDLAIADETKAIELNPKDGNAYLERGFAYENKGEDDRAIADETKAIELNPKNTLALNARGNAYENKGEDDRAIADFDKVIELDPNAAIVYDNRGNAYNDKGDYDRAIADYDKVIELSPNYANAYGNRGSAYNHKGDYDHAIADFDKVIELNPESASAYNARGYVYENKGDYYRAIVDETKAIELDPKDGSAYLNRGFAYGKNAETAKSLTDFRTAAQLIPASDPLHDKALAQVAALEKQLAAAVPAAPAAVATSPAAPAATAPAVVAAIPATPAATASLGRRVALIIGNDAYQNVTHLRNPVNDANLIANALKQDGFGVTRADNLDHDDLLKALQSFGHEADGADWAVIYYAGHGIEMAGTNYLIPVDAKLETDRDVDFEAVPLGQVIGAIDGARALRVVILDACRNNPFAETMKRTAAVGRDIGRGLARTEPSRGTEIVYSAKDGTIAADGEGADSPFASALAQRLTDPGEDVEKMFRLVRDDVLDATEDKQEPFVYGSLPGRQDFYFRPN